MPDQITELRCPTCRKLLLGLSSDFAGAVSAWCRNCKADVGFPDVEQVPYTRLKCACGKWLGMGQISRGQLWARCNHDRTLVVLTPDGPIPAERPTRPPIPKRNKIRPVYPIPSPQSDEVLVSLMERRWEQMSIIKARRNAEIAVGLRFDVFTRDGFRCRYCGQGPEQGVYLEADHVHPRSLGGLDTMENLVTACRDCNRGKSAKLLTDVPH